MTVTHTNEAAPFSGASIPRKGSAVEQWVMFLFGIACTTMFLDFEFDAGGVRIRIFDIVLLMLVAVYAISTLLARRTGRVPGFDFLLVYLVYVVYCAANALVLASFKVMVIETAQAMSFAAFFWLLTDLLRDENRTKSFIAGFLIGLWTISLGNAAYFLAQGQVYGFKSTGPQKLSHAYSLIATIVLASYVDKRHRPFLLVLILLAAILTLISGERKGWIAVAAAFIAVAAISDTGRLKVGNIAQRAVLLLALVIPVMLLTESSTGQNYLSKQFDSTISAFEKSLNPAYNPITDVQETLSNRARIYISNLASDVVSTHPAFGIGIDKFVPYIKQKTMGLPSWLAHGVHNEYLRIAAETGLVGVGLYLAGIMMILRRVVIGVRSMAYLDDHLKFRLRMGIALLVFGLVINMFRATSGGNALMLFLPAALIYFPAIVLRMPDGTLRLASRSKLEAGRSAEASAS